MILEIKVDCVGIGVLFVCNVLIWDMKIMLGSVLVS